MRHRRATRPPPAGILPEGIDEGIAQAVRQGVQGVAIVSDTSTITHRKPICEAPLAHTLPTIFSNRTYLRAGGLMSYGPDLEGVLLPLAIQRVDEVDGLYERLLQSQTDALVVLNDAITVELRERILHGAAPPAGDVRGARVGGGRRSGVAWRDACRPVPPKRRAHRSHPQRGAAAADLPVEQPTRVRLTVNLRTAAGLGLVVPPSVRLRADEVIE